MKKLIIIVLAACLLIGIPFIIMDRIAENNGDFNIPSWYETVRIKLEEKARNSEVVYTKELTNATVVSFMIQSNSQTDSTIRISSDKKLIGSNTHEETFMISNMTGKSYLSPKMILQPGTYTITVTSKKTEGVVMIGYQETELNSSEYERLLKIDQGDLNNPPEGYELAYSTKLSGLDCTQETVYSLSLDRSKNIGIAVYTNATTGKATVDFQGTYSNFIGLVTPKVHTICEQMESTFQRGDYEIQLTSKNADGEIYIFIKK